MSVKKYRKKNIVIEALVFDSQNFDECKKFIGESFDNLLNYPNIRTLEGTMRVSPNDYIIKGVQGEFYPCKPDIFVQTYENADTKKFWYADFANLTVSEEVGHNRNDSTEGAWWFPKLGWTLFENQQVFADRKDAVSQIVERCRRQIKIHQDALKEYETT